MAAATQRPEMQSLDRIVGNLSPDAYYQTPGGRLMLIALTMISGVPQRSRVVDVQCGIGSASIDLAESLNATVTAFDDYAPYCAFGRQQASARGVGKQIDFRSISGPNATSEIPEASFDVVLGLGGGLSDTLPGGLEGGLAAAYNWLVPGGVVILGDLVTPSDPSQLMNLVFGDTLRSESDYLRAVSEADFDLIFATRSSAADWEQMSQTMERLRKRDLDLGPDDERKRQRLTEAARTHPEIAYLNVAARKR